MILFVDLTSVHVEDADDLGRLEVWSRGRRRSELPPILASVEGDDDHIWIDISCLRDLGGLGRDAKWHRQFDEMITYAASHGWIDSTGSAVRAHIVSEPELPAETESTAKEVEMQLAELEQRVKRMEDVEAIKRLKALYYDVCDDDHNPDRMVELFAEHGSWAGQGFEATGRTALHQLFASFQGSVSETQHAGVNPIINVDGDRATGVWYTVGIFKLSDGGQRLMMAARYDDTYIRLNGDWKLEHLRVQLRVSLDLSAGTSALPDWALKAESESLSRHE